MRGLRVLIWKELLYLRAYPLDLVEYLISPALLVAPYLLVARLFGMDEGLQDSIAVGLILWYWLSTLGWEVGYGAREEMEEGVFESVLASPTPFVALLAAKAVATVLLNLWITAGMVGWFRAFGVPLALPWPLFVGIAVLSGLAVAGFMLIQAGVLLLLKRADALGDALQTVLGVLSGMTMPPRLLPRGLWVLSRVVPLAYGIEAARRVLAGHGVGREAALLAGLGAVYAVVGWRLLSWAERRMKARGTTGEF